jgi:hypothetical protein
MRFGTRDIDRPGAVRYPASRIHDEQREKIVPKPLPFLVAAGIAAITLAPAAGAAAPSSTPAPAQSKPAATGSAAAPAPKPIPRAQIVRQYSANYKQLDANGDGAVVEAEIQEAQGRAQQLAMAEFAKRREAAFKQLDTNKDGQLSAAEFNAGTPTPRLRPPPPSSVVQKLDADKDRKITEAEFTATTLAEFDKVDLNRDGIFSVEEQQKARASKK